MEKKKNNKSLQKSNSFWNKTLAWINENQRLLIGFGIGLLLGLFIMIVTEDEEIATLKDGTQPVVTLKDHTITADDLYSDMKNYYGVNILVNTIDKLILDEKYPETDEMLKELETTAERWYQTYETYYQTSKEDFLANNGFKSHKDFIEYLKLDYRRNEAVEDYIKKEITDKEIQEYYDKEVYGDVNTKHMLVKPDTNDKMTDEEKETKKKEALNLAKEIIAKLNTGKSFDEVKEEYKNTEGNPQIKSRIRSKMQEVSRARMMQSVPEADVVITNPTHLAVAIKYDKDLGEAPVVLAKGADYLAAKIKDIAAENKVEIVENKPLARMLYYNVEIGNQIPPELYQMVAEVLAYVYSIQGKI